jgi:hypothetical protein
MASLLAESTPGSNRSASLFTKRVAGFEAHTPRSGENNNPTSQTAKPSEGQVHPTASSGYPRHPGINMIRFQVHLESTVLSHSGKAQTQLPMALNQYEHGRTRTSDRRHRLPLGPRNRQKTKNRELNPKTQRRPGSPNSKKLRRPPRECPWESTIDSLRSTPAVPFWA